MTAPCEDCGRPGILLHWEGMRRLWLCTTCYLLRLRGVGA